MLIVLIGTMVQLIYGIIFTSFDRYILRIFEPSLYRNRHRLSTQCSYLVLSSFIILLQNMLKSRLSCLFVFEEDGDDVVQ